MKIVMKESVPGSIDGVSTAVYGAGREYDLTNSRGARELARAFIGAGLAEEVGAKAIDQTPESVAVDDAVKLPASESANQPAPLRPGRKSKVQQ